FLPLFFHPTPPPEIYTLSLHDALPISLADEVVMVRTHEDVLAGQRIVGQRHADRLARALDDRPQRRMAGAVHHDVLELVGDDRQDRKSTRLNSSHVEISYAVFCLKKKK